MGIRDGVTRRVHHASDCTPRAVGSGSRHRPSELNVATVEPTTGTRGNMSDLVCAQARKLFVMDRNVLVRQEISAPGRTERTRPGHR